MADTGFNAQFGLWNSFEGAGGNDTITGNGVSRVGYSRATAGVTVDLQAGTAQSTDPGDAAAIGADSITGGVNQVMGSAFADTLLGSDGVQAERFQGAGGFDTADYTDKAASVVANLSQVDASGFVSVSVGAVIEDKLIRIENLIGGSNADVLVGNGFGNVLTGAGGGDTLNGVLGNDSLSGGIGPDSFVFNTALNQSTNVDTIVDFSHADDTIRLSRTVFAALPEAAGAFLTAASFANDAAAPEADDRIVYKHVDGPDADLANDTIELRYDVNGGDRADAVLFAKLTNQASVTLDASDFLIIA